MECLDLGKGFDLLTGTIFPASSTNAPC